MRKAFTKFKSIIEDDDELKKLFDMALGTKYHRKREAKCMACRQLKYPCRPFHCNV